MIQLSSLDFTRCPHALHAAGREFPETNCYVDVWIEILAALGLEPRAMLSICARLDFEIDQLTFFKPGAVELEELYGIQCEELNVWDALDVQLEAQLSAGRLVLTEADAFHLPDTRGLSYRASHVKSTIAVVGIDRQRRWLRYFHNASIGELSGDDFAGALLLDRDLPPYAEIVKLDRLKRLPPSELASSALAALSFHVATAPAIGPISRLSAKLAERQHALLQAGDDYFHRWAFATLRQAGAAAELLADHVAFLAQHVAVDLSQPEQAFRDTGRQLKATLLKLARAVRRGQPVELTALEQAGACWDEGLASLRRLDGLGLNPATSGVFKVISGA